MVVAQDPGKTIEHGGHLFPGIWRDLLPEEFFWTPAPREARATCGACYLAALGEVDGACQCCTYYPQLSNYMLGLALQDPSSRDHVTRQIAAGGALPRELVAAPGRFRRSLAMVAGGRFGRDRDALCPFFDDRTHDCHIYPYRNSVCATFVCVHDHGRAGDEYWERLQQLVGHLELAVAQWAMDRAGYRHDLYVDRLDALANRVERCSDPDTGMWSDEALEHLWGEHRGHEAEFFVRCAELVTERRGELYEIARDTPLRQAITFEGAVAAWIPEDLRDQVPTVADDEYGAEAVPSLNYKLQLAGRALWRLPFGEGPVQLAEGIRLGDNPRDDVTSMVHGDSPHVAHLGEDRLFLDADELLALRLFDRPRPIDEALLQRAEITALPRPRESLAVWLRRGVLVTGG